MKTFLRLEAVGDDDDGAAGEKLPKQGGEKWLGRRANFHAGQRSPSFQSPGEGAHSGSLREVSEHIACRLDWGILRQARATSQREGDSSSRTGMNQFNWTR